MQSPLPRHDLVARLDEKALQHNLAPAIAGNEWSARGEYISAKWVLGGRKVAYSVTCRLDEASRTVRLKDAVSETSWGIPPPSLKVEKTVSHGTRTSVSATEKSIGGGGALDSGRLRAAIETVVGESGWRVE